MKKWIEYKLSYAIAAIMFSFLLSVATAFAGTATLTWTAPTTNADSTPLTDLAGYKIYYGTTSGTYSQNIDVGNVITYTVTGLTDGSTYYFAITAYDTSNNESTKSIEVSKLIPDIAPVISGIYSDTITTSSAIIHWTTNELADTRVEYGTTVSYGYASTLNSTMSTSHTQMVAGLTSSTLYNYRVLSRDSGGNLTTSGNYTFTTATAPDTTPPVISNISVSNITASSVTVTWSTDEASTTQVEYGPNTSYGSATTLNTGLVTSHSVNITGLSGFSTYDFRVRSKDSSNNEGISTNSFFTTSNTAPSTPALSADNTSGTTPLSVDFTATASDTDGFITKYEWDLDGNGTYELDTGTLATTSYIYSSIGTYSTRLRVTDNGGATSVSAILPITVNSVSNQPPVVSSMTATLSQGSGAMTVTFSATASDPDGSITQYEWDFDGNATYDATTSTSPVSHTYSSAGTNTARVRVTDNQGGTATGQVTVTVTNESAELGTGSGESSGGGCFIASAAFGSYLEPHVKVLRDFRDNYLLTNGPGTAFVKLYYRTSPPIADYISRHDFIKVAIRLLLTPVVFAIKYALLSLLTVLLAATVYIVLRLKAGRQIQTS